MVVNRKSNMTYSEFGEFQKLNLYTFYKGVCGGLATLTKIWAKTKEDAISTAKANHVRDWHFIKEEKLVYGK